MNKGDTMKVNIAAFTAEQVRQSFLKYRDTRILTLKLLYGIPGYDKAELKTKNFLYDTVKATIDKVCQGPK